MNDFIELRKVILGILKWWWLLFLVTAATTATGYSFSMRMPRVYQAVTTLMVGGTIQSTDLNRADLQTSESLAQTYANIARLQPVMQGVIDALELDTSPGALRDRVRADFIVGTQLLQIRANASTPEEAELIADEVAGQLILLSPTALLNQERDEKQRFVHERLENLQTKIEAGQERLETLDAAMSGSLSAERIQELQTEINALEQLIADWENNYTQILMFVESGRSTNQLIVLELAHASSSPIEPRTPLNTFLASLVGLVLGIGLALVLEYLDDTLKSTEDLSQSLGLATLGAIGPIKGRQHRDKLITSRDQFSPVAEAYRMLRSNIQFMSIDQTVKSIIVTSPRAGEGKSLTVANLGIVVAQAGLKTLIVDADMRNPSQHEIFRVPNQGGLTDLLRSANPEIEGYLRRTNIENLHIITSGSLPPNPADLLSSQRLKHLIAELSNLADVVIYDSPPILMVTDAVVLSNRVDATLLVMRAGKTRHGAAKQAVSNLRQAGANLLGGVINQVSGKRAGYYQPFKARRRGWRGWFSFSR